MPTIQGPGTVSATYYYVRTIPQDAEAFKFTGAVTSVNRAEIVLGRDVVRGSSEQNGKHELSINTGDGIRFVQGGEWIIFSKKKDECSVIEILSGKAFRKHYHILDEED